MFSCPPPLDEDKPPEEPAEELLLLDAKFADALNALFWMLWNDITDVDTDIFCRRFNGSHLECSAN